MITYPINIRTYLIKPLKITMITRSMWQRLRTLGMGTARKTGNTLDNSSDKSILSKKTLNISKDIKPTLIDYDNSSSILLRMAK